MRRKKRKGKRWVMVVLIMMAVVEKDEYEK